MSNLKTKIDNEAERLKEKGYGDNEAKKRAEKAFEAEKRKLEEKNNK